MLQTIITIALTFQEIQEHIWIFQVLIVHSTCITGVIFRGRFKAYARVTGTMTTWFTMYVQTGPGMKGHMIVIVKPGQTGMLLRNPSVHYFRRSSWFEEVFHERCRQPLRNSHFCFEGRGDPRGILMNVLRAWYCCMKPRSLVSWRLMTDPLRSAGATGDGSAGMAGTWEGLRLEEEAGWFTWSAID